MDERTAYRIYRSDDTEDPRYWEASEIVFKAEAEAAREFAQSPAGRLDAAWRNVEAMRATHTDSGAYTEAEIDAAQAAYDAIKAEIEGDAEARFAAEWTREVTVERRAAWNAMVKAGKFGRMGSGQVNWAAMRVQERAQGWTAESLKKAVKQHGL